MNKWEKGPEQTDPMSRVRGWSEQRVVESPEVERASEREGPGSLDKNAEIRMEH
jgi:hypothetical protein